MTATSPPLRVMPLPPACLSKLHVCDSPICLISRIDLLYSLPFTKHPQLLSPQPGMTSGAQLALGRFSATFQPLHVHDQEVSTGRRRQNSSGGTIQHPAHAVGALAGQGCRLRSSQAGATALLRTDQCHLTTARSAPILQLNRSPNMRWHFAHLVSWQVCCFTRSTAPPSAPPAGATAAAAPPCRARCWVGVRGAPQQSTPRWWRPGRGRWRPSARSWHPGAGRGWHGSLRF